MSIERVSEKKNIRSLLGVSSIDSLVCFESVEVDISVSSVEKAKEIWEKIKSDAYYDLSDLEIKLGRLIGSSEKRMVFRVVENVRNFTIFKELLISIHEKKKENLGVKSYVGSGLRTIGAYVRSFGNRDEETEFLNLTDAMKSFDGDNPGFGRRIFKNAFGNLLRGAGEGLCGGERPTVYRLIKRTILGQNPFLRTPQETSDYENEEGVKYKWTDFFVNGIFSIPQAFLTLYHQKNNEYPVAGKHFILFLYHYVFPTFGTFQSDGSIVRKMLNKRETPPPEEEEENEGEKEEEEDTVFSHLFDKSVYDRIWYIGTAFYSLEKLGEGKGSEDDGFFSKIVSTISTLYFFGSEKRSLEEEDKGEVNGHSLGSMVRKFLKKGFEDSFLRKCHKVNEKYTEMFTFRHFEEGNESISGYEQDRMCKKELDDLFRLVLGFLKSMT